jgi:hypothetical protein
MVYALYGRMVLACMIEGGCYCVFLMLTLRVGVFIYNYFDDLMLLYLLTLLRKEIWRLISVINEFGG